MYAPAYLASRDDDINWQSCIVTARQYSEAMAEFGVKDVKLARKKAFERLDEIGHMEPKEYGAVLSDAFGWAEGRYKKLKSRTITEDEIRAAEGTLSEISKTSKAHSAGICAIRKEIRGLSGKKGVLLKALKNPSAARHSGDRPKRYVDTSDLESTDDFWKAQYASAFVSDRNTPYAKQMADVLRILTGRSRKFTMYKLVNDLLHRMYSQSPSKEQKFLRRLAEPSLQPEKELETPQKLLNQKVVKEIEAVNAEIASKNGQVMSYLEDLREMRCRHSEVMLDCYFMKSIVKGKKPALFRASIQEEIQRRRAEVLGSRESIFESVRRLKEASLRAKRTPDASVEVVRRKVKFVRMPGREDDAARKQEELEREFGPDIGRV